MTKNKTTQKILLTIMVFFLSTATVFAACNSYGGNYYSTDQYNSKIKACNAASEDNVKCTGSKATGFDQVWCRKSTTCINSNYKYDSKSKKCVSKTTKKTTAKKTTAKVKSTSTIVNVGKTASISNLLGTLGISGATSSKVTSGSSYISVSNGQIKGLKAGKGTVSVYKEGVLRGYIYVNVVSNGGTVAATKSTKVKVTFNGNGGKVSGQSTYTKECTTACTGSWPAASRSGYTFAGWSTSSSCSSPFKPSTALNATKSITYYACWSGSNGATNPPKKTNGSNGATNPPKKTNGTTASNKPANLTDEEYCEKNGGYYHSGGNNITKGCYSLPENCKALGLEGKHAKCPNNNNICADGAYYYSGGVINGVNVGAGCYELNPTNCKIFGLAGKHDKCASTDNKCADGQYYYSGGTINGQSVGAGCYELNDTNCKIFDLVGKHEKCTSTDNKCADGAYYYSGGTINGQSVGAGCYKLNETNCKIFDLEGKNIHCPKAAENTENNKGLNTVLFNQYKGNGIICDNGTTDIGNGICSIGVSVGKTTKFPTSTNMYRNDNGYKQIVGWDNTPLQANGEPACVGGSNTNTTINKTSETAPINSSTTYRACYKEIINGERFLVNGAVVDGRTDYECGESFYIDYCTKESNVEYCYGTAAEGIRKIYKNKITTSYEEAIATCNGENSNNEEGNDDSDFSKLKSCSNKTKNNMSGTKTYKNFCYEKGDTTEDIYHKLAGMTCNSRGKCEVNQRKVLWSCANGAQIVPNSVFIKDGNKKCNENGICINDISITCGGQNVKPTISVSSGIANSKGIGTIRAVATSKVGKIDSYYVSEYFSRPTQTTKGWKKINGNQFTITAETGTQFIWVMDSYGNISEAVSGAVIDTKNTKNTLNKLEIQDSSGMLQTPSRVSYNVDGFKSDKYVRLSNNLSKESKVIADGFNPFDTEYKLEVASPTVSVYATLTSTDSNYVAGYEPRTVNLNYGVNTVLIKIKDNEGKIRTYTILVTRTDDRTSDNTLSDISVSVGSINYNANVTDYKVIIPFDTKSDDVKSTIASDKASYVSGYEPGNVKITGDSTVKLIKVKSETGSTRTYVINFVKETRDQIVDSSLQIAELVIPNVYVPFEKEVANYNITAGYETDIIDINTILNDENSKAIISVKTKNSSSYKLTSNNGIKLDVGENFIDIEVINSIGQSAHYRLTIIRKEDGLEISDDTTLKDLKILGYDDVIDFDPAIKEYTVKIKQEKSLVITAVPNSNRAEVFMRGNEELTGFSTVRIKVVAENGKYETYSIDIKKDAYNKTIEIASIVAGIVIILVSSGIIIVKKKNKAKKEYFEE